MQNLHSDIECLFPGRQGEILGHSPGEVPYARQDARADEMGRDRGSPAAPEEPCGMRLRLRDRRRSKL
jgi:hypothetical protein